MALLADKIMDDVGTKLTAGAAGAGVPIPKDSFTFALESATVDSLIYYAESDDVEPIGGRLAQATLPGMIVKRTLVFAVDIRAKGDATTRPRKRVAAWIAWAVKTLGGKSEVTPGAELYHLIREIGTEFAPDQGDRSFIRATVRFAADYQSLANNPEVWK